MSHSENQNPQGAEPFIPALMGTVLLAIAGLFFVNLDEGPQTFIVFTIACGAPGFFLLTSAAVAHGIQLAERR